MVANVLRNQQVNSMCDNALATQGARASATMVFSMLNRINSVPAR